MIDVAFWIIFGMILGWISSVVTDSKNWAANVALGIVGALLGGLFTTAFGGGLEDFTITSLLTAIIGAVATLTLAQALRARA